MTDYFFQIFVMGTSCVALSIKNIKTRASREMTSQQKWGERCQALECVRARYLPSLIALLYFVFSFVTGKSRQTARNGYTFPPNLYKSIIYIIHTVQITFIFIGQTHLVFGKRVCTCVTKHSNAFRTFLNWLKNLKRVWHEPKLHILRLPLFANFDL